MKWRANKQFESRKMMIRESRRQSRGDENRDLCLLQQAHCSEERTVFLPLQLQRPNPPSNLPFTTQRALS